MRPVIGIEADVDVNPQGRRFARVYEAYYEAAWTAGGNPVLLPPLEGPAHIERALEVADAFVFPGGDDLPSQDYGEETLVCERTSNVHPLRYSFGRELVRAAVRAKKPLLGVCYGHQLLNVALGGKLIQDIQIQLPGSTVIHRPPEPVDVEHEVSFEPGSLLAGLARAPGAVVNSRHHQSVKVPGEGLRVTARSADGVIEGVEGAGPFLVGVQWHPERMGPGRLGWGVFEALVAASRRD
jgi:putative glutamine amidotransferase